MGYLSFLINRGNCSRGSVAGFSLRGVWTIPQRFAGFGGERLRSGVVGDLGRARAFFLQRGLLDQRPRTLRFAQRVGRAMLRRRRMGLRLRCTGVELPFSLEPVVISAAGGIATVLPDLVGALGDFFMSGFVHNGRVKGERVFAHALTPASKTRAGARRCTPDTALRANTTPYGGYPSAAGCGVPRACAYGGYISAGQRTPASRIRSAPTLGFEPGVSLRRERTRWWVFTPENKRRPNVTVTTMNLLLLVIVLVLLFGGGGFYLGGPVYGGSGLGLVLLICVIVYLMGGFRGRR
jgi:hypothetical protein